MNPIMQINGQSLPVREIKGQRVVTTGQVANLHQTTNDNIQKNFKRNREYFIEGQDYFKVKEAISTQDNLSCTRFYFTESGYLMLVKSLTDKTAWAVQRALVQSYFKVSMLEQMLAFLPELTRKVIGYRGMGLTQKEAGKLCDISKDRVQEIEKKLKGLGYVAPNLSGKRSGTVPGRLWIPGQARKDGVILMRDLHLSEEAADKQAEIEV